MKYLSHIKPWLWLLAYIPFAYGCFTVGWQEPWVSGLVIIIALLGFFGLMLLPAPLIKFAHSEGEPVSLFQRIRRDTQLIHQSTEMIAIFLIAPVVFATAFLGSQLLGTGAPHFHIPFIASLTIVGIMVAANNAMTEILASINKIEGVIGKTATLIFMSILSSVTGESANAAIQNQYLYPRLPDDQKTRARVGLGLAATIGSGGGLTFFAPPAVLIIWATMSSFFGWNIVTLLLLIGPVVVPHVILSVFMYRKYISDSHQATTVPGDYTNSKSSIPILLLVIVGHIVIALDINPVFDVWATSVVMGMDIILGIHCLMQSFRAQEGKVFEFHKWEHDIQPVLIGILLIAIETIGALAEPSILWFGGLLPTEGISPLMLAGMMFIVTGVISALADNALATKVFILIPITIALSILGINESTGTFPENIDPALLLQAEMLAHAGAIGVIVGALTWGWITVQGNLPNFPIKSKFKISPSEWVSLENSKPYWVTLAIPFVCMLLVVQFILPLATPSLDIESYISQEQKTEAH